MQSFSLILVALQAFSVAGNPLDYKHVHGQPPVIPHHGRPALAGDNRNDVIMNTWEAGGPHGDVEFNDEKFIDDFHNRIGAIHMWCDVEGNGQMQAISFKYRDNMRHKNDPDWLVDGDVHGSKQNPAWEHVWKLELGEYIKTIDVWTYKARGHTRIGSMSFTSNKRINFALCGPRSGTKTTWGREDRALSFVSGRSGQVVDYMKGYFIASSAF